MQERTEGRISDVEDKMPPLISESRATTSLTNAISNKMDDVENRFRRNNILIVGLPEKVEGCDPT